MVFRMRAYNTHTRGGWAHRQRVSTIFLTRGKNSTVFLVLLSDGIRTLDLCGSRPVQRSKPLSQPVTRGTEAVSPRGFSGDLSY